MLGDLESFHTSCRPHGKAVDILHFVITVVALKRYVLVLSTNGLLYYKNLAP